MDSRKHITDEGVFIPRDLSSYPKDPSEHTMPQKSVVDIDIEHNYPFLDKSFKARALSFLVYAAIFLLVFPIHKIRYGLKIRGRKYITRARALFNSGALTVSNHVYRWDLLAVLQAVRYRTLHYPVLEYLVRGADRTLVRATGGIPIPSTPAAYMAFNRAFDELHAKKKWLHVFPESSRWDFYEPIRPFKDGAFRLALRYKIPVVPLVISYRRPGRVRRALGLQDPLITISVTPPIMPDVKEGESSREAAKRIARLAHRQMCEAAGIRQNMWPALYD